MPQVQICWKELFSSCPSFFLHFCDFSVNEVSRHYFLRIRYHYLGSSLGCLLSKFGQIQRISLEVVRNPLLALEQISVSPAALGDFGLESELFTTSMRHTSSLQQFLLINVNGIPPSDLAGSRSRFLTRHWLSTTISGLMSSYKIRQVKKVFKDTAIGAFSLFGDCDRSRGNVS